MPAQTVRLHKPYPVKIRTDVSLHMTNISDVVGQYLTKDWWTRPSNQVEPQGSALMGIAHLHSCLCAFTTFCGLRDKSCIDKLNHVAERNSQKSLLWVFNNNSLAHLVYLSYFVSFLLPSSSYSHRTFPKITCTSIISYPSFGKCNLQQVRGSLLRFYTFFPYRYFSSPAVRTLAFSDIGWLSFFAWLLYQHIAAVGVFWFFGLDHSLILRSLWSLHNG